MRSIRKTLAAIVMTVTMLGASPGHAETIWQAQGSIAFGAGGCSFSPTCLAFLYPAYAGGSCAKEVARQDGVEISIVAIPQQTWRFAGRFSWEAEVEPTTLQGAAVTIDFLGDPGDCKTSIGTTLSFTGPSGSVFIPSGVRWALINARQAVNFTWTLTINR